MNKKVTGVVYQDPRGNNKQGYIIDGKTYKDSAGTQRVEVGSTVPTAGGTFTLTGAGGVKTPGSIANDLSSAYKASESHLSAAKDAAVNGIKAATNRTKARINDQKQGAGLQYQNTNRAAYQDYVNASNPYGAADEQKARLGLSDSGYSETSKMKIANTYQQALSENALARDAYIRELDAAYRDAEYNGDIQLAQAIADYEKLVYKHGIDAAESVAAQGNKAYTAGIDANQLAFDNDMRLRDFYRTGDWYDKEFDRDERRYQDDQYWIRKGWDRDERRYQDDQRRKDDAFDWDKTTYWNDFYANERHHQDALNQENADRKWDRERYYDTAGREDRQFDQSMKNDVRKQESARTLENRDFALKLASMGASNEEIAKILGISKEELDRITAQI